jgi:hypothetical protein
LPPTKMSAVLPTKNAFMNPARRKNLHNRSQVPRSRETGHVPPSAYLTENPTINLHLRPRVSLIR